MLGSYVELLEQLVASVEQVRHEGEELPVATDSAFATRDFFRDRPTVEEYDALIRDVARRFWEVVAAVEAEWGPAEFIEDRHWRRLIPLRAIESATWLRGGNRDVVAAVYYEHEDTELPIELVLGAFDLNWLLDARG